MNKLKMILPAVAILFAIAGAWATNEAPKTLAVINVSFTANACERAGGCDQAGTTTCVAPGSNPLFERTDTPCPAYNGLGNWVP